MNTTPTDPVLDANGDPVPALPEDVPVESMRAFFAGRVPARDCPHYIAQTEARAGFTHCENCEPQKTRGRYRKPRRLTHPLAVATAFVVGVVLLIGACSADEPPAETETATVADEPETAKPAVVEPEPEPKPEPEFDELTADDVILTIKTLEQKCFGSAGCRVQFRVEAGWGLELDPDVTYEVTYEIEGGDDPMTLTMEIEGEYYYSDEYERIGTTSSDAELVAVPTFVEARS